MEVVKMLIYEKRFSDLQYFRTDLIDKFDSADVALLFPLKIFAWKKLCESEKDAFEEAYTYEFFLKNGMGKDYLLEVMKYFEDKKTGFMIFDEDDKKLIKEMPEQIFISLINSINNVAFYSVNDYIYEIMPFHPQPGKLVVPKEVLKFVNKYLQSLDFEFENVYNPFPAYYQFAYEISKNLNVTVFTESEEYSSLPYIMNMLDNANINPAFSNPINNPAYREGHVLKKFDVTVTMIFQNLNFEAKEDVFGRFNVANKRGANFIVTVIEHVIAQTDKKAIIFVPTGFLGRGLGVEKLLRKDVIDRRGLEAVVVLPERLFMKSLINMSMLIIDKTKKNETVLFVDAKDCYKSGNKSFINMLSNIDEIFLTLKNKEEKKGFSKLVNVESIKNNDYNLSPNRYILFGSNEMLQRLEKYSSKTLGEMAEIMSSVHLNMKNGDKEVCVLQISDINDEGIIKNVKSKKHVDLSEINEEMFLKNYDVVLTSRVTTGRVGIILGKSEDETWLPGQTITVIRTNSEEEAIYLFMILRSEFGQILLESLNVGSRVGVIPTRALRDLAIPILPEDKKKEVIEMFKKEKAIYDEIERMKQRTEKFFKSIF